MLINGYPLQCGFSTVLKMIFAEDSDGCISGAGALSKDQPRVANDQPTLLDKAK